MHLARALPMHRAFRRHARRLVIAPQLGEALPILSAEAAGKRGNYKGAAGQDCAFAPMMIWTNSVSTHACSLAWHMPRMLRDGRQRRISAKRPPSKTPQVPSHQPPAGLGGSSEGRTGTSRCPLSEVQSIPNPIGKMHCESSGGSARCKISPRCAADQHRRDHAFHSHQTGLAPRVIR